MKQPLLTAAIPALVEYQVDGAVWRCSRFDLLAAEFNLARGELPLFQAVASSQPRRWLVVRRLFGIGPVMVPRDADPDDLRLWEREELRTALGLTRPQLQAELDAVRGAWQGTKKAEPPPPPEPPPPVAPDGGFVFPDDEILRTHGFTMRFTDVDEAAWFCHRVRAYDKILKENFTAMLARNALMFELQIKRLDQFLSDPEKCKPGSELTTKQTKLRRELDETYQRQLDQLRELCPWAGELRGKHSFNGVLSDITVAMQSYMRNDTRLVDGIFTAFEIQIECRRSTQAPEPRYRAGLVVFLNAAKAGLWDPNWEPPFTPGVLKRLDVAWKAALMASGDESGEPVPDLQAAGPEGEYPEIVAPPVKENSGGNE